MTNEITPQPHGRDRAEIESHIHSTTPPWSFPPRAHPPEEDDRPALWKVAPRTLREPRLPNAGAREREYLARLRELRRDESLDPYLQVEAGRYATALQDCLPTFEEMRINDQWVTLPGCHYSRRPVTAKTNKYLFNAAMKLMSEATARQDRLQQWFAQYILDGMSRVVSNFKMDCLYFRRGPDGTVTRFVRFMNVHGEVNQGNEIGGTILLPNKMFSARRFAAFVWDQGNFVWFGGRREFDLLQWDVFAQTAV
jgi:hypothetical protein